MKFELGSWESSIDPVNYGSSKGRQLWDESWSKVPSFLVFHIRPSVPCCRSFLIACGSHVWPSSLLLKTEGSKLPSRHGPQAALLSKQTNRSRGCSSFKSKEWVGKFTVTKSRLIPMDTPELLLILPDRYQNTFCIRGFAKPAVRRALFGCCADARRSATERKHHRTISEPLRKYSKFHYKSPGCNSLDSRHLEIFAGVERTEEINSSGLFCFIWKVVYSLISLRK